MTGEMETIGGREDKALKKAVKTGIGRRRNLQLVNLSYPALRNTPKGKLLLPFEKLTMATTFVPEAVPHVLLALPVLVSEHSLTIRS